MVNFSPLLFNKRPKEAAVIPFPKEETTPPVIKTYLVIIVPPIRPQTVKETYNNSPGFNSTKSLFSLPYFVEIPFPFSLTIYSITYLP
jgi:hypothetical protein